MRPTLSCRRAPLSLGHVPLPVPLPPRLSLRPQPRPRPSMSTPPQSSLRSTPPTTESCSQQRRVRQCSRPCRPCHLAWPTASTSPPRSPRRLCCSRPSRYRHHQPHLSRAPPLGATTCSSSLGGGQTDQPRTRTRPSSIATPARATTAASWNWTPSTATPGAATMSGARPVATPSSPCAARRAPALRSSPLPLTTRTSPSTRTEPLVLPSQLRQRQRSCADTLNLATALPFGRAFASRASTRRRHCRLPDRQPRRRLPLLLPRTSQRAYKPRSAMLTGLGGRCNSNAGASFLSPAPSLATPPVRWRPSDKALTRRSPQPSPPPWASQGLLLPPHLVPSPASPCGTTATALLTF